MPCCIDRMRFSPMFYDSAEKSNFFAFFCIFFVFSKSRDLCVAPDFRRAAARPALCLWFFRASKQPVSP